MQCHRKTIGQNCTDENMQFNLSARFAMLHSLEIRMSHSRYNNVLILNIFYAIAPVSLSNREIRTSYLSVFITRRSWI